MKTDSEIVNGLFERQAKYNAAKQKRRNTALISAGSALVLALVLVLAFTWPKKHKSGELYVEITSSPAPVETPTPAPTPEQTDVQPPTVDPQTEAPTEGPEPPYTGEVYHFLGCHNDYIAAAHTVLAGGSTGTRFTLEGGGVIFGYEDDRLVAYESADVYAIPQLGVRFFDPVASFPAELGRRARASLESRRAPGSGDLRLYGFIGENYVIFTDDPYHDAQTHAIFRTDDGENWYEFGAAQNYRCRVTGGCILNDRVGYLCLFDRSLMMYDSYTPRQLTVLRTTDGGQTWENIGLSIPADYEGRIAPPSAALSPVFEGEHGAICVTYSVYDAATDGFEDGHTAWFMSGDGGESWEFIPEAAEV